MVKYLVIRFSSIGDIVLTSPVMRHLKHQVEEAEIHYLTKSVYTSLLEANPHIDYIHSYDGNLKKCIRTLRKVGFDYIIDLHRNMRSARIKFGLKRMDFSVRKLNFKKWMYVNFKINRLPDLHMVDRNLETIRTFISEPDQEGLDYFIPESDRIDNLPEGFQNGFIALAIGAQHETKKLPPEMLISLCEKLEHPVVILGGEDNRATGEMISNALPQKNICNGCGKLRINQSASMISQAALLITHDTGMMHIGAAFKRKIITVWGSTLPAFGMFPYKTDPASVQFEINDLKCRPCSKLGHSKCPRDHFSCMRNQDVNRIASMANRLFPATVR